MNSAGGRPPSRGAIYSPDLNPIQQFIRSGPGQAEFAAALADLDAAVRLSPRTEAGYAYRGFAHLLNGDFDLAEHDLDKAIDLNPRNASTRNARGTICLQTKEFDKAIQDFASAAKLVSNWPALHITLGNAYLESADADSTDPRKSETWRDKLKKASDCFALALKLDGKLAVGYFGRGRAHFRIGQAANPQDPALYRRAIEDFNKASQLDRDNVEIVSDRLSAWLMLARLSSLSGAVE